MGRYAASSAFDARVVEGASSVAPEARCAPDAGGGVRAVEVDGLCKAFGARAVLREVSFALDEGSFLSVFGPNGVGKTTLLRHIATLDTPDAGAVRVLGRDAACEPTAVRASVGLVTHASMLYGDQSAEENLVFYGRLYAVPEPRARALELLDAVELTHRAADPVREFSRGMLQRLALARALVHDPAVVLLDEPHTGLDPHAVTVVDRLFRQCRDENRTVIMVSHDVRRGLDLCTHCLVLGRGAVKAFGSKDEVLRSGALEGGGLDGAVA